jgi:hypothetical protein
VTLLPNVDLSGRKAALSLQLPYRKRQGALEANAMIMLHYDRINRFLGEMSRRLDVTFRNELLGFTYANRITKKTIIKFCFKQNHNYIPIGLTRIVHKINARGSIQDLEKRSSSSVK